MITPADRPDFDRQHPLLVDRPRLDRIVANMEISIGQILYRYRPGDDEERVLHGGVSSADVLQQSLVDLLKVDGGAVTTSWEALSRTIAVRRAIDAVRVATKGRRAPNAAEEDPDEVTVIPFDIALEEHTSAFASYQTEPESAFVINEQLRVIRRLIRDLPDPLHRQIVNELFFLGRTRAAVAEQVGLTPQRVGQIYGQTLRHVWEQALEDPEFPAETDGGNDQ
jgi:DNA-directed RNA polymerase specialized sigma24 family protein